MVLVFFTKVLVSINDQCNIDLYDIVIFLNGYSLIIAVEPIFSLSIDYDGIHAVEVIA